MKPLLLELMLPLPPTIELLAPELMFPLPPTIELLAPELICPFPFPINVYRALDVLENPPFIIEKKLLLPVILLLEPPNIIS
jgi:hypothetical protein